MCNILIVASQGGAVRTRVVIDICVIALRLWVGCHRRDMYERYGKWNSVYVRFRRLAELGVWGALLQTLVEPGLAGGKASDHTATGSLMALVHQSRSRQADHAPAIKPDHSVGVDQ